MESVAQNFRIWRVADPVLVKGLPDGTALADLQALGAKFAAAEPGGCCGN
jgi:hypothetical protein